MSKLVTIQVHVPMCPDCGGGLKINPVSLTYQCLHCGSRYKVIDQGKGDRALICEQNAGNNRQ